ncbi:MAG: hypothetical protein HKN21_03755 [Candidatus Eisenbacteria bacterium]|uniref:Rhodanese domain-containing protein n=1 Tax=Eiseniibacteriota bacterium TaxID=2212470 RepID=A0A7Y2E9F6_UNCEI|nr:hypothetical protein [Candidatus Eisenbacteria bacterium]
MRNQPEPWWESGQSPRLYTDRVDRWELTPRELKRLLDEEQDVVVVDVREPWEAQLAPFEGSLHIPMGELDYRADEELDRDTEVVLVCHHGARSMDAAVTLWSLGFERVCYLAGGIDRWADVIDPSLTRY